VTTSTHINCIVIYQIQQCEIGFGYSAYWVAPALSSAGRIVLTEHDPDELDMPATDTRGIIDYFHRVRDDPDFETMLVPVGEGVLVSVRLS
jgi:predicted O-methyltransferase YrrM